MGQLLHKQFGLWFFFSFILLFFVLFLGVPALLPLQRTKNGCKRGMYLLKTTNETCPLCQPFHHSKKIPTFCVWYSSNDYFFVKLQDYLRCVRHAARFRWCDRGQILCLILGFFFLRSKLIQIKENLISPKIEL